MKSSGRLAISTAIRLSALPWLAPPNNAAAKSSSSVPANVMVWAWFAGAQARRSVSPIPGFTAGAFAGRRIAILGPVKP